MDFYVRYWEEQVRRPDDNPTIGLILCAEKSEAMAKSTLLNDHRSVFAAKYLPYLPSEQELQAELERERLAYELRQLDQGERRRLEPQTLPSKREPVATGSNGHDRRVPAEENRGGPLLLRAQPYLGSMAISADQLAAKLDAVAQRLGVDPQVLVDRFIAELDDDPLETFIGIGTSGDSEPFEIRTARGAAAEKKFARNV